MGGVDIDDVSGCPTAAGCESCGIRGDLGVVTLDTPVGVLCATICGTCVGQAAFPRWSPVDATYRVLAHCEHLGIDLEQMADARETER